MKIVIQKALVAFVLFCWCFSGQLLAQQSNQAPDRSAVLVVDISGSMGSGALLKAQIAMKRLSSSLLNKGVSVAVISSSGSCDANGATLSMFYTNEAELSNYIDSLRAYSGDNITFGFAEARKLLIQKGVKQEDGQIYMFGDGDGLSGCIPLSTQLENWETDGKPKYNYRYLGIDWTEQEQLQFGEVINERAIHWDTLLSNDENTDQSREAFIHAKDSYNYRDQTGQVVKNARRATCLETQDKYWEIKTFDSTSSSYVERTFVKEFLTIKQTSLQNNNSMCEKRCSLFDFIEEYRTKSVCGVSSWRLATFEELELISKLSTEERRTFFNVVRKWPHVSGTKSSLAHSLKGINFEDNNFYTFSAFKPYSAILVADKGIEERLDVEKLSIKPPPEPVTIGNSTETGTTTNTTNIQTGNRNGLNSVSSTAPTPVLGSQPSTFSLTGKTFSILSNNFSQISGIPELEGYYVGTMEIKNDLFEAFAANNPTVDLNTECENEFGYNSATWREPGFDFDSQKPATCIDAEILPDFLRWVSTKFNVKARLPTIKEWRLLADATVNPDEPCLNDNVLDESGGDELEIRNSYKCDDGAVFPVSYNGQDIRFMRGNLKEIVYTCNDFEGCNYFSIMGESWRDKIRIYASGSMYEFPESDNGIRMIFKAQTLNQV